MKEVRVFGPPGTGKTSYLATRAVPAEAEKWGPDRVIITSFTKAGAREIANKPSRETGEPIPVPPDNVGTLHAICYRLFDQPTIAETRKKDWNARHPALPMSGRATGSLDEVAAEGDGDGDDSNEGERLLNRMNILRNKQIERDYWPDEVLHFARRWDAFKADGGLMDFTDLIERAFDRYPMAPGRPDVIFVDEAQDFTRLQLALVRSWARLCHHLVLVGDDDQTIYRFTGASPDAFLAGSCHAKRVLDQSWRVPRAILERAMGIIGKVTQRAEKAYKPRYDADTGQMVEGVVETCEENWKNVDLVIDEAVACAGEGKSVMFLASCSYMIDPLKMRLKERGVPFANPYRRRRADWNPLAPGEDGRVMAADLLGAFFGRGEDNGYWTIEQLLTWARHLRVGEHGLVRGKAKKAIQKLEEVLKEEPDREGLGTCRNVLAHILAPGAVAPALDRDIHWLQANLVARRQPGMEYPLRVIDRFGLEAIRTEPKIIVGTIHSVKGAEADVVVLFPDISFKAMQELFGLQAQEARDSLYRLFYVGMTRARERLILMDPAPQKSRRHVGLFVEL